MNIEDLENNLHEGMIQIKDPKRIIYQIMVQPEVERIVNTVPKDQEDIEETLIEVLEFFEETSLCKDEIFILIELLNELDKKVADKYLIKYEEIINRL